MLAKKGSMNKEFILSKTPLVKLLQNKTLDRKKGSGRIEKKATDNQKNVQP